jgi:CRP-like cAMP-binding protein
VTRNRSLPSRQRLSELRSLAIFAAFDDADLAALSARLTEVDVPPGTVLLKEGEPGREAFIVASGRAELRIAGQVVGYVGGGDLVGEMALLDARPRSASVVAATHMRLLVMDPSEFASLLEDPRSARWIAANLSNRVRALGHPS